MPRSIPSYPSWSARPRRPLLFPYVGRRRRHQDSTGGGHLLRRGGRGRDGSAQPQDTQLVPSRLLRQHEQRARTLPPLPALHVDLQPRHLPHFLLFPLVQVHPAGTPFLSLFIVIHYHSYLFITLLIIVFIVENASMMHHVCTVESLGAGVMHVTATATCTQHINNLVVIQTVSIKWLS